MGLRSGSGEGSGYGVGDQLRVYGQVQGWILGWKPRLGFEIGLSIGFLKWDRISRWGSRLGFGSWVRVQNGGLVSSLRSRLSIGFQGRVRLRSRNLTQPHSRNLTPTLNPLLKVKPDLILTPILKPDLDY